MGKQKDHINYGVHVVHHALDHAPQDILELWIADTRKYSQELQAILLAAKNIGITIQKVHPDTLDDLTGTIKHQGVAIKRRSPETKHEDDLMEILCNSGDKPKLFLILDGIQDPHNLGACLRTADAAGVNAVIAPKDNAAGLNATVSKVASGAAESVPFITVTNLARTMRDLQEANIWLIGTEDESDKDIYAVNLTGHIAIVMGGEGKGLRQNTRKHCDDLVRIPMLGTVESLNVSVAAGVCLYEALRQRRQG